jgi:hypothetical protein
MEKWFLGFWVHKWGIFGVMGIGQGFLGTGNFLVFAHITSKSNVSQNQKLKEKLRYGKPKSDPKILRKI